MNIIIDEPWFPKLTDDKFVESIRSKLGEEVSRYTDNEIIEYFASGRKYTVTFEDLDDAYDKYEKLADAYINLLDELSIDYCI